jgi:hypothetical protein
MSKITLQYVQKFLSVSCGEALDNVHSVPCDSKLIIFCIVQNYCTVYILHHSIWAHNQVEWGSLALCILSAAAHCVDYIHFYHSFSLHQPSMQFILEAESTGFVFHVIGRTVLSIPEGSPLHDLCVSRFSYWREFFMVIVSGMRLVSLGSLLNTQDTGWNWTAQTVRHVQAETEQLKQWDMYKLKLESSNKRPVQAETGKLEQETCTSNPYSE